MWFAKSLEEPRASNARADLLSRAASRSPARAIASGSRIFGEVPWQREYSPGPFRSGISRPAGICPALGGYPRPAGMSPRRLGMGDIPPPPRPAGMNFPGLWRGCIPGRRGKVTGPLWGDIPGQPLCRFPLARSALGGELLMRHALGKLRYTLNSGGVPRQSASTLRGFFLI